MKKIAMLFCLFSSVALCGKMESFGSDNLGLAGAAGAVLLSQACDAGRNTSLSSVNNLVSILLGFYSCYGGSVTAHAVNDSDSDDLANGLAIIAGSITGKKILNGTLDPALGVALITATLAGRKVLMNKGVKEKLSDVYAMIFGETTAA